MARSEHRPRWLGPVLAGTLCIVLTIIWLIWGAVAWVVALAIASGRSERTFAVVMAISVTSASAWRALEMLGNLDGKVAVVTGAESGIGAALVQACAERGMNVVAAEPPANNPTPTRKNPSALASRTESTGTQG